MKQHYLAALMCGLLVCTASCDSMSNNKPQTESAMRAEIDHLENEVRKAKAELDAAQKSGDANRCKEAQERFEEACRELQAARMRLKQSGC